MVKELIPRPLPAKARLHLALEENANLRTRIAALEAKLAERAGGVNEDALRALAQAYDREDAAQRGEPDPWNLDDPGDIGDSDTWVSERLACAQVAAEAFLAALEPATPEAPASRTVTEEMVEALKRIRDTAMEHTLAARIPECGVFGGIAQDADWLLSELTAAMEAGQ